MIYTQKNIASAFALPLLDLTSYANHGYLFKLTSGFSSEAVTYFVPVVSGENERFTQMAWTPNIKAGQYRYEVFEFDGTQPDPTDETGLTKIATGFFVIVETDTNSIYI
jgi:hypothetical protein